MGSPKVKVCPDCGTEMQKDEMPSWKDIRIPIISQTIIIGRWVDHWTCPQCVIDLDPQSMACEEAYNAGCEDGYKEGRKEADCGR